MVEIIGQTGGVSSIPASGVMVNGSKVEETKGGSTTTSSSTQAIQEETKELKESKENKEGKSEKEIEELKKELMKLTEELNREFNPLNMNIKFGFSDDIESLYVTVSERDSNRLIRKIPSDEAIELMAKMREIVGIIFDKKG